MESRLQPALFGGLFIGVLSALPFISVANCCCCLWVVAGGVLAAYLRQQSSPFAIPASEGALIGLMAGFIGGIVGSLLSIPMEAVMGPLQQQLIGWMMASGAEIPPELRDMMQQRTSGAGRVVGMVFTVIVYTIFGMLGGLLGVAMFKKNAPPPPPLPGTVEVLPPE